MSPPIETNSWSWPLKPFTSADRQQVEVVQDVACVDVRERGALAATRQVRVAVAALRARAHRQVRLGARRHDGDDPEVETIRATRA
jgi:hypothetical protein